MFENDDFNDDETSARRDAPADPATRAKEKSDEFRMHAELAAVFEGPRKFGAELKTSLDADIARDVQRTIAKLEKAKTPDSPVLPAPLVADAARLLNLPAEKELTTVDYHVHRRPGEVMIVRWLAGEEVETFYTRLQAHFDAALDGFKEDERQALEWKGDEGTAEYLKALDAIEVKMAERYLREWIKAQNLFVLNTQTADEINIQYLTETVMGVPPAELVGAKSAPPSEEPTERDLAWFFKLFSLRGMKEGVEEMCFFAFLQKTEDTFGDW